MEDTVACEVPIALVYNGISHAVMMASPMDLADFGLGFSLSEGILGSATELYDLEIEQSCEGILVQMEITTARFQALKEYRRSMVGRTGCGLCGVDSLSMVRRTTLPKGNPSDMPAAEVIFNAIANLGTAQVVGQTTGSLHAAAWVNLQGEITAIREDVGRHVALDKLIGARARTAQEDGFLLVTSRASYEMVQKALMAEMSTLVAISAPTAMAIDLAKSAGMNLIGFAREKQISVYS
jgi:FdhD protein